MLKSDIITVTVTPSTAVDPASQVCVLDAAKDKAMQVVLDQSPLELSNTISPSS